MAARWQRLLPALAVGFALLVGALALLSTRTWEPPAAWAAPMATTRYVATTGTDTGNDCINPNSPCRTVQYAVDRAAVDDEIRVATGVYTGVQARAGITQMVYISQTVTVRGGYSTDFSAWDPEVYSATLSAEGLGRVLVITSTITPTVEGLHITGGDAAGLGGDPGGWDAGGGVYIHTATATISRCVVYGNVASSASVGYGGGLYLHSSAAVLNHNTIQGNVTGFGNGGGLYLHASDATLTGNTVEYNVVAFGSGGGLYLNASNAVLSSNTVLLNFAWAGSGGGLYLKDSHNAILSSSTVLTNTAMRGGGVYLRDSDATLTGNTIADNVGGLGGGVYVESSNGATIGANVIRGNTANMGGGAYLSDSGATLSGNAVISNTVSTEELLDNAVGGGVHLYRSAATLSGNTIVSNTATSDPTASGFGGGVSVQESSPFTLTNNLVAANRASTQGSGLWLGGTITNTTVGRLLHTTIADNDGSGQGVFVGEYTTPAFTNTILVSHTVGITVAAGSTVTLNGVLWFNNGANTGGAGLITVSNEHTGAPNFVDPDGGDYHVRPPSAAINRGVSAGVSTDLDGEPRPWGAAPDLGADEFACYDVTGNDQVDVDDIQAVAGHWRDPALYDALYDVALPKGVIDIVDVMAAAAHWGEMCP